MKLQKQHTKSSLVIVFLLLLPSLATAEYRTVNVPKAIVYDSPSAQGKKLYLLSQGYPVEVIVNLAEWVKVRTSRVV